MAAVTAALLAFNRGLISKLALARTDLKRTALSAEEQTNWMPRTLGSMMLRPGLEYIGEIRSDLQAKHIPFIFSATDTALIECTDSNLRVRIDDTIVTRISVSSAVSNGTFDTDLTDWTDADESGASSTWATGGYLSLVGTRDNAAIRRQTVTVATADENKEHALRIVIERGPVTLKVGTTDGDDSYIAETSLGTGTHSLAFTPTGDFHIELSNTRQAASLVDSVAVEASGDLTLPTPWTASDLALLRWDQSGDIIFVACDGHQQRMIERRAAHSWSIVLYGPEDGPFRTGNIDPINISTSATTGDVTLTASSRLFKSGHVGALFRIASIGQHVASDISTENTFTDPISVAGIGTARGIGVNSSGTWVGTLTLQRSVSAPGAWEDVPGESYTANVSETFNDGLDNQIIYYRLGFKSGDFTSGSVLASLDCANGSISGIARITSVASGLSASAAVIVPFGSTASSENWWEGEWSDYRGFPTCVSFYEGRLWWAGRDKVWGSVSDAFSSFDDATEGDSGPIARSIGSGPVDTINWLLPLQRLILGGEGAEISARSSSLDDVLTPTNFNLKDASTQGSSAVAAVKIDASGMFVQKSGRRLFSLDYSAISNDYSATDQTLIVPDLATQGFTALAVQRQPDTRIHGVLGDGTVAVLVFDPAEDVRCWVKVETDGNVEDVVVLPGTTEDVVYYAVKRTVDGSTVRYLEKWAQESDCQGSTLNKQADSFVSFTNAPASSTVSSLSHLEGKSVVVWADGKCLADADGNIATFTVSSGTISLTHRGAPYNASSGIVGLSYDASYKSVKLAYGAQLGTALTQRKRITRLGLVLANTHAKGLQYGPDFTNLDDLPEIEDGASVDADTVWETYDKPSMGFPGEWSTDSRLCLFAQAPRPCTVLAAVVEVETNERI